MTNTNHTIARAMGPAPSQSQNARKNSLKQLLSEICSESTSPEIVQLLATSATTGIHPMFARKRWSGVSEKDFLRMSPALVLASRLLKSPQSLHFWHPFFFGPRTEVIDLEGKERLCFHRVFQDQSQPLPLEEELRVRQKLKDAALAIENITLDDSLEVSAGSCHLLPTAPVSLVWPAVDSTHPGRCSQISINKQNCDALDPKQAGSEELRRRWLLFAKTLVHEAAHAISVSSLGSQGEQFYEACPILEMGFAIEQQLFGGRLGLSPKIVFVSQVCCPHELETYRSLGKPLSQQSVSPVDARIKTLAGDEWVASLFKDSFWEGKLMESNGMALRPPYRACFCLDCLSCIDETALVLTARQTQLLQSVRALSPKFILSMNGTRSTTVMRLLRGELRAETTQSLGTSINIWKMREGSKATDEEEDD